MRKSRKQRAFFKLLKELAPDLSGDQPHVHPIHPPGLRYHRRRDLTGRRVEHGHSSNAGGHAPPQAASEKERPSPPPSVPSLSQAASRGGEGWRGGSRLGPGGD